MSPMETDGLTNSSKFLTMEEGGIEAQPSSPSSHTDAPPPPPPPPVKSTRLASLDIFRGLTVALMILVDDLGGLVPAINHSPWDGVTLADFVMPFFLFIVGLALALAYKRVSSKVDATKTAVRRTIKLFVVGLILQGGYFHSVGDLTFGVDIDRFRWMGVLQRIAIAYVVTSLCEIWLKGDGAVESRMTILKKYRFQLVVALTLTTTYIGLLYGLHVPDWEYQVDASNATTTFTVKCGVRGDTRPACNAVGMIDRAVLGIRHLYQKPIYSRTSQCSIKSPDYGALPRDAPSWCQAPFEPEGLLSSIMAIVSCMIGLHYGHVIAHFKNHKDRILHWTIPGFCLVAVGLVMHVLGMHLNKALYSLSYTCVTTGAAGILFAGLYAVVDVWGYRRPFFVLEWMGKHAMMIFILFACNLLPVFVEGLYWKKPENNLLRLIRVRK